MGDGSSSTSPRRIARTTHQEIVMARKREKMDWATLTEEDAGRRRSALRTLLSEFDVPVSRLDFTRRNLQWLNRNVAINNADNPMLETVSSLLTWLLRWETRQ